jgi:hypothetical protein
MGREILWSQRQLERGRLEAERVAGAVEGQIEDHAVRAHLEDEAVQRRVVLLFEDAIRHR